MEIIILAAIKQDGLICVGEPLQRHHNIISSIYFVTNKRVDGEQGFLTNKGRFVTREEAAEIAIKCGQIKEKKYNKYELFSEELW